VKKASQALDALTEKIIKNNTIDQELYDQYDVKRGLRNKDGSGVLAGLTQISSVIGARNIDYQRYPVEGELAYRGYNLFDIAEMFKLKDKFVFEKVAYLLLVGEKADKENEANFIAALTEKRQIPDVILEHAIKGIPSKDIMNKVQTTISALYSQDADPDSLDPVENFRKSIDLTAKLPLIIAYSYLAAFKKNPKFVVPEPSMSIAEGFLYALYEGKTPSEFDCQILDLCLAIHAEHGGGNNSTFTTAVVTSSGTDIYSAIAASLSSLKGPLHGSANSKVMAMMDDIKKNVKNWNNKEDVREYLKKILDKKAHDKSGKIYGLGHAVYTKSDPRAILLKVQAQKLAELKNRQDELQLYFTVETEGPELFQSFKGDKKVISANVDFFSGFVYDCLEIPREIYTPMFAMARITGWCAHRIEEILSGKRIIRPGYKYVKPN
jgi:citrate synthase